MGMLSGLRGRRPATEYKESASPQQETNSDHEYQEKGQDNEPVTLLTLIRSPRIAAMALIVSMGGLIFGFDTGQISGFTAMPSFLRGFHDEGNTQATYAFSNTREGLIVGLLSIGTLVGALLAGPIADRVGRRISIVFWCIIFMVGVIAQITTGTHWYQIAIGRLVAGFGVGGMSVLTPMYQSETAPRQIRGAMVSMYQLFITFGIFLSNCINFKTTTFDDATSWRLTMGIGFIFPVIMSVGIMFMCESPRWDYRKGRIERARTTIAKSYGVSESHVEVVREMNDIRLKYEAETVGGPHPWYEIFTGPRMAYRTILGITLQAMQQLTGANYFFYYGTQVFQSVGLPNSFVTAMILGGVNFGSTFLGLYVVERFGRRPSLVTGGLAMFVCFLIFASVGHFLLQPSLNTSADGLGNQTAGYVMIVFACLFIFSYAITWGPMIWALVAELFPTRYRARSMGICTASNWIWNFIIAYFTPYITNDIDFAYGYVFAFCTFCGAVIVYLFVIETQGRTLEEIDTMYIAHVKPWKSKHWRAPEGELLGEKDDAWLSPGGDGVEKGRTVDAKEDVAASQRREEVVNEEAGMGAVH